MFPLGQEEPSIAHICPPLQLSLLLNPSPATKQLCDPVSLRSPEIRVSSLWNLEGLKVVVYKSSNAKSTGIGQCYHCHPHPNHGLETSKFSWSVVHACAPCDLRA